MCFYPRDWLMSLIHLETCLKTVKSFSTLRLIFCSNTFRESSSDASKVSLILMTSSKRSSCNFSMMESNNELGLLFLLMNNFNKMRLIGILYESQVFHFLASSRKGPVANIEYTRTGNKDLRMNGYSCTGLESSL